MRFPFISSGLMVSLLFTSNVARTTTHISAQWRWPSTRELFERPVIVIATVRSGGTYSAVVHVDQWVRGKTKRTITVTAFNDRFQSASGVRHGAFYNGEQYLLFLNPSTKTHPKTQEVLAGDYSRVNRFLVPAPFAGHFRVYPATIVGSLIDHSADRAFPTDELLDMVRLAVVPPDPARPAAEKYGRFLSVLRSVGEQKKADAAMEARQHLGLALLALHGSSADVALLEPFLNHPNPAMRREAVRTVQLLPYPQADHLLARFLFNDTPDIVSEAAYVLGRRGNVQALPDLQRALRHADRFQTPLQRSIADAIKKLQARRTTDHGSTPQ
ncbi:MAG: HEAT repeat domain-containing protein [Deltaproteobacteria bacterium]|nr:HEAT repeat domain-containing protein [Deltaproteobacteria bacterium]